MADTTAPDAVYPDVVHVAEHMLRKHAEEHGDAPMDAEKLHCLVYYVQCWSLAFTGSPAFDGPLIAAAEGPRSPKLVELVAGRELLRPGDLAAAAAG